MANSNSGTPKIDPQDPIMKFSMKIAGPHFETNPGKIQLLVNVDSEVTGLLYIYNPILSTSNCGFICFV